MTYEQTCEIANVNAFTKIINAIRHDTDCVRVELFNSRYDETCYAILTYDDHSIELFYCMIVYDECRFFNIDDEQTYIDIDVSDAYDDARIINS